MFVWNQKLRNIADLIGKSKVNYDCQYIVECAVIHTNGVYVQYFKANQTKNVKNTYKTNRKAKFIIVP